MLKAEVNQTFSKKTININNHSFNTILTDYILFGCDSNQQAKYFAI